MASDTSRGDDEIRRLQGFSNDLISIQALPAIWSKLDPSHIVSTLLDVLLSVLRLDFAYARLSDSIHGAAVEMVRRAQRGAPLPPEEIGRALAHWVTDHSATVPVAVQNPVGDGEIRIAPIRLGLVDEIGVVIAGSTRADFPTQTETLLLRVAANQALVALQEARQANEQKRTAEELERRVAERTSQLTAVKIELAEELSAMTGLYQLSTRLLANTELRPLLEEVLNATITLQNADFGNLQLYNPKTRALEIVAQRGFRQDFLDHFASVHDDGAACGRAMNCGERVIVKDVLLDPAFEPHRAIAASAGFRAVQSTPLLGRGGKPLGMISTHFRQPHRPSGRELRLTDLYARRAAELIEHKRADETLRESEEKYRTLFDSMDEGFCTLEVLFDANEKPIDLRVLEVNPAFEKQTGIQNVRGKRVRELILLEDHWFEIYGRIALTGEPARFENEAATLHRWFDVYAFRIGEPQERKVAVLFQDVTVRKHAEERLREYEKAVENLEEMIVVVDRDYRYRLANRAFLNYRGLEREELVGRRVPELLNEGVWEQVARGRMDEALQGKVVKYELRYNYPKLGEKDLFISYFPIEGPAGIDRVVCVLQDITERKRAEEALRVSEERFRSYFELGLIGMAITSRTKGCLEVNDELCRILGYERSELLQMSWAEITHPDDLAADVAQFTRLMAGEIEGYTLDKRWICKQGHVIDSIMAAKCLRRDDGSVDYFVGLVLDTTERKRAEEKLRRSEANLAEGQRISQAGSWAWNVSSGEMFCSQELLRIFGFENVTAQPTHEIFLQVIHPEDRERVGRAFDEATRSQTDYGADYRIVLGDGSIRHIHNLAHPVFNDAKALVEYVGTAMDITERKQGEEAVRKAHERVDLILASISDQFFGLSKDWRFTYFNEHAAAQMKLLGKDPVQLIGKVLWEEFPEVPNEANLRQVMSERVAITDELYYEPLGEWVENHMYPSHDGGLVTFQRYVTSRKRTEEELRKTQEELAHVTRITAMGELAASIAHEINQPLGAIVNNSNVCLRLLADQFTHDADGRGALTDIVHDAERASAIIARVRAMTTRTLPKRTSLQLRDVIADVLALAHRQLAEHCIETLTEIPEDLPRVSGDRVELQQVFLNLIINGLDAMSSVDDDRRVLTIRGQRDELHGEPAVRISVQDLGRGVAPADMAHLFEAFYTTKPQGMGMGLRIGTSIVEALGGRLSFAPNDGPGVTFSCVLPAEIPGLS
ncbi:MAG: hypothetical protein QOE70_1547 [Chthoniobacter sp.]|nr:hypothetical protein [Chthoniobacter sp.]